ncbi:hypothetical protein GGX14DRAFT_387764 [Mycena pura]|uniref:Uncharacterized protein n=1 Tax=Mycena pura TaxID=153505 RepID=A0AAD6YM72_9AGAR|nr:hypothetical protein GGX14DRAFT_387764 [Mycena pura]
MYGSSNPPRHTKHLTSRQCAYRSSARPSASVEERTPSHTPHTKASHECHGFKPVLYSRVFRRLKPPPVSVPSGIRTVYSPQVPGAAKTETCTRPIRGKRVLVSADGKPADAGAQVPVPTSAGWATRAKLYHTRSCPDFRRDPPPHLETPVEPPVTPRRRQYRQQEHAAQPPTTCHSSLSRSHLSRPSLCEPATDTAGGARTVTWPLLALRAEMPQVNLSFPTGRESNLFQTPLHGYCARLKLSIHCRLYSGRVAPISDVAGAREDFHPDGFRVQK